MSLRERARCAESRVKSAEDYATQCVKRTQTAEESLRRAKEELCRLKSATHQGFEKLGTEILEATRTSTEKSLEQALLQERMRRIKAEETVTKLLQEHDKTLTALKEKIEKQKKKIHALEVLTGALQHGKELNSHPSKSSTPVPILSKSSTPVPMCLPDPISRAAVRHPCRDVPPQALTACSSSRTEHIPTGGTISNLHDPETNKDNQENVPPTHTEQIRTWTRCSPSGKFSPCKRGTISHFKTPVRAAEVRKGLEAILFVLTAASSLLLLET